MSCAKDKYLILGSTGLVGTSLLKYANKTSLNYLSPKRKELDLFRQEEVEAYFKAHNFNKVIVAAAKVGGIEGNLNFPADFIMENLTIQNNIFNAFKSKKDCKLLFLGSSCIYPKFSKQPIKESELLTGPLEDSNRPYAVAKIAGVETIKALRRQHHLECTSLMLTNLFGLKDNYNPQTSHVIPGMIKKIHDAKKNNLSTITLLGDGSPTREFLFAEDLADCIFKVLDRNLLDLPELINVGSGHEITIKELAETIKKIINFQGTIIFDGNKDLNGTPRKVMDSSFIKRLGWQPKTSLEDGLKKSYEGFLKNHGN